MSRLITDYIKICIDSKFDEFVELNAEPDDFLHDKEAYGDSYVSCSDGLTDEAYERLWGQFRDYMEEELDEFVACMIDSAPFCHVVYDEAKEILGC